MISKLEIGITSGLFFGAVLAFIISCLVPAPWNDLFVNLSAGFLSSVITIWGIEFFRRRAEEKRLVLTKKISIQELGPLANMFVSYIANPLGFWVTDLEEDNIEKLLKNMRALDLHAHLDKLTTEQWQSFQIDLRFLESELNDYFTTYRLNLSPELQGWLLATRAALKKVYRTFYIFQFLYVNKEKDWPANESGNEKNKAIKQTTTHLLAEHLKDYFEKVEKLFDEIRRVTKT